MNRRVFLIATLALAGCEGVLPEIDWQQMIDQHKYQPYEACDYFADGRAMQPPPDGTVPRDRLLGQPALTDGLVDGQYVAEIPVPLTRELLSAGRFGFQTYCAACHGLDGSGESEVARNMEMRKPPSLVGEPVRSFPAGRVYQVATDGYGLMPSYQHQLSRRERWAVVAWLRALQMSQAVSLASLPPDARRDAEAALASPTKGLVEPTKGERPFGHTPEQSE